MTTTPLDPITAPRERYTPPEGVATRTRAGVRTALGWLSLAIVFCVVIEVACRIEDWVMYRTPLLSEFTKLNDLIMRDVDGMHGRPNARYQKWIMNNLGTRGPDATVTPSPGTVRVITVGASETFGMRESPGKEYPRQLEDSLNARVKRGACDESTPTFEVLNAAFAGMSTPTIEQDVRNRLRRFQPAFVVIYPTPAQYVEILTPFPARPDSSGRLPSRSLIDRARPRVLDRFREQIKEVLPEVVKMRMRAAQARKVVAARPPGWQFTTLPLDRLANYETNLRLLIGSIRRIGATPVLVTHGNIFRGRGAPDPEARSAWAKFYPRSTGDVIIALDSAAREVTLRIGADLGIVTVDAADRLAKAPLTAFADFVHFTDFGASIMADTLSAGVLNAARASGHCGPSSASPAVGSADQVIR